MRTIGQFRTFGDAAIADHCSNSGNRDVLPTSEQNLKTMCACFFRAEGEKFDVDDFLSNSPWKTSAEVRHAGEPKSRGTEPRRHSSITLSVTDDDNATINQQTKACREFISQNKAELLRLMSYPGAEARWFRLSYYLPIGEVYAICPYFDQDFLSALVSVGTEFDFTVMCCSVE